ncbi:phosphopantetheine-binding protein [Streptomyces sp. NBC_00059]|uniref:phosphopantetheine-binding protein n=1 Tax=Streptomyces sp. NBC_00059 TaxID=2975635 RepID=UPI002255B784|nr:phosphopantetheine-binding protein [Streptomyces sp. NBC_00059]MCX5414076.1 phosphopantetheine-binding protein [Streptomyces sp. NBC_00059]
MSTWDKEFEGIIRSYLPFLSADEPLEEDAGLRDLGLDSMGTVELLAALENSYGVRFVDEALSMETFATPGVLWAKTSELKHVTHG